LEIEDFSLDVGLVKKLENKVIFKKKEKILHKIKFKFNQRFVIIFGWNCLSGQNNFIFFILVLKN
jgi:hypothetical protein